MRIIAGEFRGRRLLPPDGANTRPITDRVKQSLFDILTPWIGDALVFDIFAGTGSMGLESLSRGARCAWFFEADRGAIKRLQQNIQTLGLVPRQAIVIPGDLFKWFANARSSAGEPPRADLVFLDPPYRFLGERGDMLQALARQLSANHLNPGAQVIFRHDAADSLQLPGFSCTDRRDYGGMALEFLAVEQQPTPDAGS